MCSGFAWPSWGEVREGVGPGVEIHRRVKVNQSFTSGLRQFVLGLHQDEYGTGMEQLGLGVGPSRKILGGGKKHICTPPPPMLSPFSLTIKSRIYQYRKRANCLPSSVTDFRLHHRLYLNGYLVKHSFSSYSVQGL